MSMPNLLFLSPVEMYGCVLGSTSGFTRTATRPPVRPTAHRGEELQDSEAGVRLDGKADQTRNLPEGLIEDAKMAGEGGVTVQIEGGPNLIGKGRDGDLFTVEVLTPVVKVMHG